MTSATVTIQLADGLAPLRGRADFEAWAIRVGLADSGQHGCWFHRNGGDGLYEAYIAGAQEQRGHDAIASRDHLNRCLRMVSERPPDRIARMLDEIERLRSDAERYRWLRKTTYNVTPKLTPPVPHLVYVDSSRDWQTALDDAIDAAIKEEKK